MSKSTGRPNKYPFRELEVNDTYTFDYPYSRSAMTRAANAARSFCIYSPDCKDRKHSVKKIEIDGEFKIQLTRKE